MGEAVLALHRAGACRFELSSIRTSSIRDQIVRGSALVDAMVRNKIVTPGEHRHGLLVIGAGVAGCACAMWASAKGVHVTLADPEEPLSHQQLAANRRVDPVEFDWPQPHWDKARFPVHSVGPSARAGVPMAFESATAQALASRWQQMLYGWKAMHAGRTDYGELGRHKQAVLASDLVDTTLDVLDSALPALRWQPASRAMKTFGAAVACTGFGSERVQVAGSFAGQAFWGDDRLAELQQPRADGRRRRVLVSGGGDGAMQDFQRAATGHFGKALFERLQAELAMRVEDRDLYLLMATEDECRRMHAWRFVDPKRPPDRADVLRERWHRAYLDCAERVWQQLRVSSIGSQRHNMLLQTDVTWVLRDSMPGHCYGLNRFLSLIVARLIADRDTDRPWCTDWGCTSNGSPAQAVVHPRCALLRADCLPGHELAKPGVSTVEPGSSADACFDQAHALEFEGTSKAGIKGPGTLPDGQFDVVVIRNGVEAKLPFFFNGPALNEQLLPYDLF